MPTEGTIRSWGERGLVTTSLFDCHRALQSRGWEHFLEAFSFVAPGFTQQELVSASVVIEPDFSNEGFGHPDAILRFEFTAHPPAVFILEAKRLPYAKSCLPSSNRGGTGYNSKLNGQLELNHCLALALSTYTKGQAELCEPGWILHSPYGIERRGKLRCLKNPVVIEEVAYRLTGIPFRSFYHLVITHDGLDPFDSPANEPLWPELYHPDFPYQNAWKQLRAQFAWASWDSLEAVIRAMHSRGELGEGSYFLPTLEMNRRNFKVAAGAAMDTPSTDTFDTEEDVPEESVSIHAAPARAPGGRGSRGASMIYAPSINRRTFLHFSWLNESCAIRDYSQSPNIMPLEDRQRRASEVFSIIEKEVFIRNRKPISDMNYWYETTVNLNKTELPALLQR